MTGYLVVLAIPPSKEEDEKNAVTAIQDHIRDYKEDKVQIESNPTCVVGRNHDAYEGDTEEAGQYF